MAHALVDDAGRGGDVLERAVALVVVEPAAVAPGSGVVAVVLAADEQVEPAVVVVVAPDGRLGRERLAETAGDGHVLEDAPPLFRKSESRAGFSQAPRRSRTSGLPSLS